MISALVANSPSPPKAKKIGLRKTSDVIFAPVLEKEVKETPISLAETKQIETYDDVKAEF